MCSGSYCLNKLIVTAERTEWVTMHNGAPVRPAILADSVATTQCLGWQVLGKALKAYGTLFLFTLGQKVELLLKVLQDGNHRLIVLSSLFHHVVNKPFAGIVRDPHGLAIVDPLELLVNVL